MYPTLSGSWYGNAHTVALAVTAAGSVPVAGCRGRETYIAASAGIAGKADLSGMIACKSPSERHPGFGPGWRFLRLLAWLK